MCCHFCSPDIGPGPDGHAFGDQPQQRTSFGFQGVWGPEGKYPVCVLTFASALLTVTCLHSEEKRGAHPALGCGQEEKDEASTKPTCARPSSLVSSVRPFFFFSSSSEFGLRPPEEKIITPSLLACSVERAFQPRVGSEHPGAAFFSAEELHFPEYVLSCRNKSLSDTREQEERKYSKIL